MKKTPHSEWYKEWNVAVSHANIFYPESDVFKMMGFFSICSYTADQAQRMSVDRDSIKGEPVYLDTLYCDFDDQPEAAAAFCELLIRLSVEFTTWDSGNRSVHYHIPIVPLHGAYAPYSQKVWMASNAPGCDLSFYHASGYFRLPNTVHRKTGRRKELIDSFDGQTLDIPYVEPKVLREIGSGRADPTSTFAWYCALMGACPGSGSRYQTLWQIGAQFKLCGYSSDTIYDLLWKLNESWKTLAKEEEEVRRAVKDVFRRKFQS
jgi:hypothetical protein